MALWNTKNYLLAAGTKGANDQTTRSRVTAVDARCEQRLFTR